MFMQSKKSQAGFSLVELMVVVAIIGVLASIAVPSINKYLAKARQTEAKTQLSALYTSEKAFYAEYTTYDPRFLAVGYSPEGQLRYNVGFNTCVAVANAANNGYNVTPPPANTCSATVYCAVVNNGCTLLRGASGQPAPAIPAPSQANATVFIAAAAAVISSTTGAPEDRWSINQMKVFTNLQNGIP